ncbi:MAG TPA: methyltransferase domain-containing protein [Methylomirabilota bacterium]|nr:methyltransferase domain-containing protein [Methylomirabilota bacterium]HWO93075.1 methyltransferase domain-containing protein [Methylomirabilota bacterium]
MADDPRASFAPVAANYSRSKFHASSDRLQEVVDLVNPLRGDLVLDVATGTGNTAFALAPLVRRVVGLDLTREMLEVARRLTTERKIENVDWVIGDACVLPFADETFDVYVVRAAPHHFRDIDLFLSEAHRVLRPGRDACFIDCAPPTPARDVLHEVEKRRDPSHVMSLTVDEWTERLEKAGFEVEMARARELDWDYDEWMHTMAVRPELAAELATVIESAEGEARAQLHPERRDGKLWHAYWHCLIRAHKPD